MNAGEEVCQLMRRDFRLCGLKCSDEANLLFSARGGGTMLLYANRPAEAQTQTQHKVMEIYSKVSCGPGVEGIHLRYKQTHSREISSRVACVEQIAGRVRANLGLGELLS